MKPANEIEPLLPWHELMALGMGQLGLCPKSFWQSTPRELMKMLEGRYGLASGTTPMQRANLKALMQRFPDHA